MKLDPETAVLDPLDAEEFGIPQSLKDAARRSSLPPYRADARASRFRQIADWKRLASCFVQTLIVFAAILGLFATAFGYS